MTASPGYKAPDMHTTRISATPTDGFLHKNDSSFTSPPPPQLQSYKHLSKSKLLSNPSRYPKKHFFLEGFQASPVCPPGKSNVQMKISTEHRWSMTQDPPLSIQHFSHSFSTTFVIPASYQCWWLTHLWQTGNIWHPLLLRMRMPMHF